MSHIAYLALGSNQGNRLEYLQKALLGLEALPLTITAQSHLYETPAWGFEGPSFLNACVAIQTTLSPQVLLSKMLQLEEQLGRQRATSDTYRSRTIDLDLLAYEDIVLKEAGLTLPHPLLHEREFVLRPLAELAPTWVHPLLEKTVLELEADLHSHTALQKPFLKWSAPLTQSISYWAIEGNIGVGKTTLTQLLAAHLETNTLFENFRTNPHLASFYENPQAYAKAVESFFLNERYQALHSFWQSTKQGGVIADFSLYKSVIFARQNLNSADFLNYVPLFESYKNTLPQPELILYLEAPTAFCLKRIEERGRSFERTITANYLQKIEAGYKVFFAEQTEKNVLKLAVEERDFKNNPHHFQWLLRRLSAVATL